MSTGSKVILFFYWRRWPSWIYRIAQGYPVDIRYTGPKDVESSEKNDISRCMVRPKYQLWRPDYTEWLAQC